MTEPIPTTARRRPYDAAKKTQILAGYERPGASIAAVAMAHGINANLIHNWRARAMRRQGAVAAAAAASVVPVLVPASATSACNAELRIELRRGPVRAVVSWPLSEVGKC
ncbi:transposase [Noviherbaspirillum galbum]|uniref:Transposase n=1 Tax=Noviherbaspirillum galbum TaxID=2709383 RepID=A0A6B3SVQ7_9BURK|nr:transposase [Noviherbaspirillum galbum]NEX64913.1 transposase [Noviherbaspirillum galbum]